MTSSPQRDAACADRRCAPSPVGPVARPLSVAAATYDPRASSSATTARCAGTFCPRTTGGAAAAATCRDGARGGRVRPDEQVAETAWLTAPRAHGFPDAMVAHAWLDSPDTEERLLEHQRFPAGARHPLQAGHRGRAGDLVPGRRGTMQDEAGCAASRSCANTACPGTCACPSGTWPKPPRWRRVPEPADRAEPHRLPLGPQRGGAGPLARRMEVLARQPNVHVKLSEFGLRTAPGIRTTPASCATPSPSSAGSAACSRATSRWPGCASAMRRWSRRAAA